MGLNGDSGGWTTPPPKLIYAVTALVCMTVLMATRAVDSNAGVAFLSSITFYALGNGMQRNGDGNGNGGSYGANAKKELPPPPP